MYVASPPQTVCVGGGGGGSQNPLKDLFKEILNSNFLTIHTSRNQTNILNP